MLSRNLIITGLLFSTIAFSISPVSAEVSTDTARLEKLEERMREMEGRMATMEASFHKKMGMGMMHDDKDMMGQKGMKMNSPMGQTPQDSQQNQGTMQQPTGTAPTNNMPSGGMGHM